MIINAILLAEKSAGSVRIVSSGWDGVVMAWDVLEGGRKVVEIGKVSLGQGRYVNTLAWADDKEFSSVFAGGKDGMLVKIEL